MVDKEKFRLIANSLREYRRAELLDYKRSKKDDPVDYLYTDPLDSDAVLQTVLAPNTTFLIGRKGTGKSTIFAKAQREIRRQGKNISVYIDVKALSDNVEQMNLPAVNLSGQEIDKEAVEAYLLRKTFLSSVLKQLISEVRTAADAMGLWHRWTGKRARYEDLMADLEKLEANLSESTLQPHELPVLQVISSKKDLRKASSTRETSGATLNGSVSTKPEFRSGIDCSLIDEALTDNKVFEQYSTVLLRSLPFADFLENISTLLESAGLYRLFVFFDDFSELEWIRQRLFVDVILAPLNNTSNEKIKLKVAAYPGRVYFGKIDPGKIDQLTLDFFSLYKSPRLPEIEKAAVDYTRRLLEKRFSFYKVKLEDYLDTSVAVDEYYRLLFSASSNIPRVLGYILHYCYLDRVSKGKRITPEAIRTAAQRYYEINMLPYFELNNRYALEPYARKLDRRNQEKLLEIIVAQARSVRRQIITGALSGNALLRGLSNPPTSHFTISSSLEHILSPLELNQFVTKYHEMRDKDGKEISVFALHFGLCVREGIEWGYPRRQRYDKDYFKQRCFNYNAQIHEFLASTKTIRCSHCGASFPMDDMEKIAYFKWRCPSCFEGTCSVVNLDGNFRDELRSLRQDLLLEPVELAILKVLHDENEALRAKEIAGLLDVTYQLVGKRTDKLRELGYVDKEMVGDQRKSKITDRARAIYFTEH